MALHKELAEPWFGFIRSGRKTVEGRLVRSEWARVKKGDKITFFNDEQSVTVTVEDVVVYPSFQLMLETEGLARCLPEVQDVAAGVGVYRSIYSSEDESKYGVVAVRLNVV